MSDLVLVTGISGFIAKRVVLDLLLAGYRVRGTVRSLASADKVKRTLAKAGADVSKLEFASADLGSDQGWAEAVKDCRYIQHIASPFPLQQPKGREALVPAARDGALRVLKLSLQSGAERVVLTSSTVAMMYRANRPALMHFSEQDWTDPEWPLATAYIVSKTRAEKAAWDYAGSLGAETKLTTVNPGFVMGPTLDEDIGTSLQVLEMFLKRKYPAVPPIAFPCVDVRDVSAVHLQAMVRSEVGGRRLLATADTMSMPEIAAVMKKDMGPVARRVPGMTLPSGMIKFLALFDPAMKTIVPDMGCRPIGDSQYTTRLTGVAFRPAREAVISGAQSLIDLGIVSA